MIYPRPPRESLLLFPSTFFGKDNLWTEEGRVIEVVIEKCREINERNVFLESNVFLVPVALEWKKNTSRYLNKQII